MPHNQQHLDAYHARPEMALAKDYIEAMQTLVAHEPETLREVHFITISLQEQHEALDRTLEDHAAISDLKLSHAKSHLITVQKRDDNDDPLYSQAAIDSARHVIETMAQEHPESTEIGSYIFCHATQEFVFNPETPTGLASLHHALFQIESIHNYLLEHKKEVRQEQASPLEQSLGHLRQQTLSHLAEHAPHYLDLINARNQSSAEPLPQHEVSVPHAGAAVGDTSLPVPAPAAISR